MEQTGDQRQEDVLAQRRKDGKKNPEQHGSASRLCAFARESLIHEK
jgi:hypothetical protein